jgi:ferredoxin
MRRNKEENDMKRQIIEIDTALCNGCGLCADACAEGAIGMVSGKARLLRDDYCDGLGNCLPVCPTGAIRFISREAKAYDEAAVQAKMRERGPAYGGGCPGATAREIRPASGGGAPVPGGAVETSGLPGDAGGAEIGRASCRERVYPEV